MTDKKKVIFIIADGLSFNSMKLPSMVDLSALKETDLRDFYPDVYKYIDIFNHFSYRGFIDSTPKKDIRLTSADIACMMSIGRGKNSPCIKDFREEQSLFSYLKSQHVKVAGITNCPIADSTIGMFLDPESHIYYDEKRDQKLTNNGTMECQIAKTVMDKDWDLLVGGGRWAFFPREMNDPITNECGIREDKLNLLNEIEKDSKIQLVFEDRWNHFKLKNQISKKTLALLHNNYFRYQAERTRLYAPEPRLSDLCVDVLDLLDGSDESWFCIVESGRIDHAAHLNHGYFLLGEVLELFRTIHMIQEREQAKNYTIIVVSDHGTGGLSFYDNTKLPFDAFKEGVFWTDGPGKKRDDVSFSYQNKKIQKIENYTPNIKNKDNFSFQASGIHLACGSHSRELVPLLAQGSESWQLASCHDHKDLYYAVKKIFNFEQSKKYGELLIICDDSNVKTIEVLKKLTEKSEVNCLCINNLSPRNVLIERDEFYFQCLAENIMHECKTLLRHGIDVATDLVIEDDSYILYLNKLSLDYRIHIGLINPSKVKLKAIKERLNHLHVFKLDNDQDFEVIIDQIINQVPSLFSQKN